MDWGDTPIMIFIAGITLLAVCSSLLGVLVGWWLRGRQVKEMRAKAEYLQAELTKAWAGKAKLTKAKLTKGVVIEGKRIDAAMALRRSDKGGVAEDRGECGARNYAGREEDRWMLCSRPRGHHLGPNGTKHGYAGVFWGQGER